MTNDYHTQWIHALNECGRLGSQLAEAKRREAELQAEVKRLMELDGDRCKSHNFYLIRSSRLEDELARKQLDCEALDARVKTLEDALITIKVVLSWTPQVGYKQCKPWTAREECLGIAKQALAAKTCPHQNFTQGKCDDCGQALAAKEHQ